MCSDYVFLIHFFQLFEIVQFSIQTASDIVLKNQKNKVRQKDLSESVQIASAYLWLELKDFSGFFPLYYGFCQCK